MEDAEENSDDMTFVKGETIKPPTKHQEKITKQIFDADAISRTKKLVDMALSLRRKRDPAVKILDSHLSLNDTADFQIAPTLRNSKSRLRLKSSSSSRLKNGPVDNIVLNSEVTSSSSVDIKKKTSNILKDNSSGGLSEEYMPDKSTGTNTERALSKKSSRMASEHISTHVTANMDTDHGKCGTKTCFLCGIGVDVTLYKDHRAKCLRENFAKGSGKVDRETAEPLRCQICSKDISHMNTQRQSQHLNKCIDKDVENNQNEEVYREQLERAKTSVLGCPICGRKLKTQTSRQSHLKKCAASNKMTVDQVKTLIRQQEEEHNVRLDAGVLPEDFVGLKGKGKSSKTTKPKTQLDEDTQLALALSTSLAEDRRQQEMDFISVQEGQLGVRPLCSEQEVVQGKGKRNKGKQPDSENLLTTLPREKAMQRISHRVDKYIFSESQSGGQPYTPPFKTGKKIQTELHKSSLQETPKLWSSTSLENFGPDDLCLSQQPLGKLKFYVRELMPPVSMTRLEAGSKLKRVSAIPGRRRSGETNFVADEDMEVVTVEEDHQTSTQSASQTVAILAELAAEGNSDSQSGNEKIDSCQSSQAQSNKTATIVPEFPDKTSADDSFEASGFYTEDSVGSVELDASGLSTSYTSLVNASDYCDLLITCQGGSQIKAHKLILHARCPLMLTLVERKDGKDIIDLSGYGEEAVLSVLKYVYGGQVSLFTSCLEDVKTLAERFLLKSLADVATSSLRGANSNCVSDTESRSNALGAESMEEDDEYGQPEMERESDFDDDDWLDVFQTQRENLAKKSDSNDGQCVSFEAPPENVHQAERCADKDGEGTVKNTTDSEDVTSGMVESDNRAKNQQSSAAPNKSKEDTGGNNTCDGNREEVPRQGCGSIEAIASWGLGSYTVVMEEPCPGEKSSQLQKTDEGLQKNTTELEAESARIKKLLAAILKEEDSNTEPLEPSTESVIEEESLRPEKKLTAILKEEDSNTEPLEPSTESVIEKESLRPEKKLTAILKEEKQDGEFSLDKKESDEREDFPVSQPESVLVLSGEKDHEKAILFEDENSKMEDKVSDNKEKEESLIGNQTIPSMRNEASPVTFLHGGNIDLTEGTVMGSRVGNSFISSHFPVTGSAATPKKKRKVSAKQFKKIVDKVKMKLPQISESSGQISSSDMLTDVDISNIAMKIEQDFQAFYNDEPNSSFYIPSVLDTVDIDPKEITITHADIKEPRLKPKCRLGTRKGAASEPQSKSLPETEAVCQPCSANLIWPGNTDSLTKAHQALPSNKKDVGKKTNARYDSDLSMPQTPTLCQMGQQQALESGSNIIRQLLRESILSKSGVSGRNVHSSSSSEISQLNAAKKHEMSPAQNSLPCISNPSGSVQCMKGISTISANTRNVPEPVTLVNSVRVTNKINESRSLSTTAVLVSDSCEDQNPLSKLSPEICDDHFSGDDLFSDEENGASSPISSCMNTTLQKQRAPESSTGTQNKTMAGSEGNKSNASQSSHSRNVKEISNIESSCTDLTVDPLNEASSEAMLDKDVVTKKSVSAANIIKCLPPLVTENPVFEALPAGHISAKSDGKTNSEGNKNSTLSALEKKIKDELVVSLTELIIKELNSQLWSPASDRSLKQVLHKNKLHGATSDSQRHKHTLQNIYVSSSSTLTTSNDLVQADSTNSAQADRKRESPSQSPKRNFTSLIKKSTSGSSSMTLNSSQIVKNNTVGNSGSGNTQKYETSRQGQKEGYILKQPLKHFETRLTGTAVETPKMSPSVNNSFASPGKQELSLSQRSSNSDKDLSVFMDQMENNLSPTKEKSKRKMSSPDKVDIPSKCQRVSLKSSVPISSPAEAPPSPCSKAKQDLQPSSAKSGGQSVEIPFQSNVSKKNAPVKSILNREDLIKSRCPKTMLSKGRPGSLDAGSELEKLNSSPEKAKTFGAVNNSPTDQEIIWCRNFVNNTSTSPGLKVSSHLSNDYDSPDKSAAARNPRGANSQVSPSSSKTRRGLAKKKKDNCPNDMATSDLSDSYESPDKCHTPRKHPEASIHISPLGKTRRGLAKKNIDNDSDDRVTSLSKNDPSADKCHTPRKHIEANTLVSPNDGKTRRGLVNENRDGDPDDMSKNDQSPDKCHTPRKYPEASIHISPLGKTRRGLAKKNIDNDSDDRVTSLSKNDQIPDKCHTPRKHLEANTLVSPNNGKTRRGLAKKKKDNDPDDIVTSHLSQNDQSPDTYHTPRKHPEANIHISPNNVKTGRGLTKENKYNDPDDIIISHLSKNHQHPDKCHTPEKRPETNTLISPNNGKTRRGLAKKKHSFLSSTQVGDSDLRHSWLSSPITRTSADREETLFIEDSPAQAFEESVLSPNQQKKKLSPDSSKESLLKQIPRHEESDCFVIEDSPEGNVLELGAKEILGGEKNLSKKTDERSPTVKQIKCRKSLEFVPSKFNHSSGITVDGNKSNNSPLKGAWNLMATSECVHSPIRSVSQNDFRNQQTEKSPNRLKQHCKLSNLRTDADAVVEYLNTGVGVQKTGLKSNESVLVSPPYKGSSHEKTALNQSSPKSRSPSFPPPKSHLKSVEADMDSPLPLRQRLGLLNPFQKKTVEQKSPVLKRKALTNRFGGASQLSRQETVQVDLNNSEILSDGGFNDDKTDGVCVEAMEQEDEPEEAEALFESMEPKTPVNQTVHKLQQKKRKEWKEPSPFTPMASYDTMETPELKKAMAKFGAKPVGKKRMRELLKHIYQETHQYETDSDYDGTPLKPICGDVQPSRMNLDSRPASRPTAKTGRTAASSTNCEPVEKKKKLTSKKVKVSDNLEKVLTEKGSEDDTRTQTKGDRKKVQAKGKREDNCDVGLEPELSKQLTPGEGMNEDVAASQDSSYSDGPDLPEESILQGWPDDEIAPSQLTQSSAEAVTEKLVKFVSENRDIYESILMYEPLELDVLKKRIADAGIRVGMAKVLDFLDERCITFTMKNMSSRNNNRQKKRPGPKKPRSPSKRKTQTK